MNIEARLDFIRKGMGVKRYHQRYTCEADNVGKHSAGVAMFLVLMNDHTPSAELLVAALAHDLPECVVGDIPSPAKRAMGRVALSELNDIENRLLDDNGLLMRLTSWEKRQLKLADCFDGLMFCIEERRRGNTEICTCGDKYALYITEVIDPHDNHEAAIRNILIKWWRQANDNG